jgi:hypothetical protein
MKKYMTVIKATSRLAIAGLMLLGMAFRSSAGETVIPPSDLPYGLSYEEWSAKWWQFYMGQSTNHLEAIGDPAICSGPASSVRFLTEPLGGGTVTNKAVICHGTPLFFAVVALVADNTACPISDFTTNTVDQLAAEVEGGWAALANITTCTIDGVPVAGLENPTNSIYNVVSPPFSYTTAEKGNVLPLVEGEDCIPGGLTIYPAVTDGVYLMLSPLSPGKHTIHIVGVLGPLSSPYAAYDVTYDLEVLPDFER